MHVFLHTAGSTTPTRLACRPSMLVADLLDGHDDESIWLESGDKAIDPQLTLEAAGLNDGARVHRSCCASVRAHVSYNGQSRRAEFPASTPIGAVLSWATGPAGFGLSADQIPKHSLVAKGSDELIASNVHVGSLTSGRSCEVQLLLVPKVRFEG
jgi:hypothetical protein